MSGSMNPGKYDDILSPYVKRIWSSNNIDLQQSPHTLRFFADGCPGLMFQQADSRMIINGATPLSTLFLYGQTVKPVRMSAIGSYRIIVLFFYPHVLKALFGLNANELTDTCLDVRLMTGSGEDMAERLLNTPHEQDRIILLKEFIAEIIVRNSIQPDRQLHWVVSTISRSIGNIRIREIQQELKFSERTFNRRFEQHVGVSPKQFANICRFNATLQKLESGNFEKLSDIAFETGFADQSHFIRSFKEFSGETPKHFLKGL